MRINKESLQKAINLSPTKRSQTMSIGEMSKKIEDGSISIPMYQRGLSWNNDKVVALFNYELFGKAPVAPISFNEINLNNDVPQLSFVTREFIQNVEENKGNLSVVDGQQRLTTNYKAYSNDESFSNIVLDVINSKFKEIKGIAKKGQIPVGILLNRDQAKLSQYVFNNYSQNEVTSLYPLLVDIRGKLLGYSYTIHIADDMTENEQIEWFEVLNNAGSRVSMIELTLSKLRLHDFDMYSGFITPYQDIIKEYGFDELFSPFSSNVSYPIASLNPAYEVKQKNGRHNLNYAPIPSDTKERMIIRLTKQELEDISDLTLQSLRKTLEFIFENELQKYIVRMQHIMYLTGYFVFNEAVEYKRTELIEWVKNVSFDNLVNGERRNIFNNLITNNI
ncbi:DUF262 domain-containing protein [Leuconostoc citreum]|uniref:DUF262 domain-containing protein n=1 Tax=Leuconostoc citreum TaxID=33964 RepID=UPI0011BB89CA|nr:DUF262 domain-containing protein [Leuconostoc citreum]QEA45833.1 DUF262 domain-containing protein [Leuconostoc citreum]QEA62521.1 DUF262 domain-containing protein [Leuconostoc citreum]